MEKGTGTAQEPRVNCAQLQQKYSIPMELFLDAIALGMNDQEIKEVTGLELQEVKNLRRELGGIGSSLDVTHKKDICLDANSNNPNSNNPNSNNPTDKNS